MSSYTLFIVHVTIYYLHIAVLCFSYQVIYHIYLICVYLSFSFMFHGCINLRSGYGTELYVPEGTITVLDSDLYLYDLNKAAIMIKTGIYVIDPNGASISVNCMLQQLYPYRHAYLSNYSVISRQSVLLCFLNNLLGMRKRYLIISCVLMRYSLPNNFL